MLVLLAQGERGTSCTWGRGKAGRVDQGRQQAGSRQEATTGGDLEDLPQEKSQPRQGTHPLEGLQKEIFRGERVQ